MSVEGYSTISQWIVISYHMFICLTNHVELTSNILYELLWSMVMYITNNFKWSNFIKPWLNINIVIKSTVFICYFAKFFWYWFLSFKFRFHLIYIYNILSYKYIIGIYGDKVKKARCIPRSPKIPVSYPITYSLMIIYDFV